jgi:outer membrane protein assembly factor BamB
VSARAERKPEKQQEPPYAWGEAPAGAPEVLWEHSGRPLWAQAVPERQGVLLVEKERVQFRQALSGAEEWTHPARDFPDELAVDGSGFLLAQGRDVRELDPAGGAPRWRQRMGGVVTGLALDGQTAYVSTRGPLCAVDRRDGGIRWRAQAPWEPELHPLPDAGLLVVDDPDTDAVFALHTADGARLWDFSVEGNPLVVGPAVGGSVLVAAHAAGLLALDARTGERRWELVTGAGFEAPALVREGIAYATDGAVHAIRAEDGQVLWSRSLADRDDRVFGLWLRAGALLAETWGGRLLVMDPADGSLRWERLLGQVHGAIADSRAFYLRCLGDRPDNRWSLLVLDQADGALLWELQARRMIQDLTGIGPTLIVELKNLVLALRAGQPAGN